MKTAWLVAIVVAFNNETKFVFSSHNHHLDVLNQLVKNGGSPVGLLRFVKENGAVQGYYRPFEEYANEPWVKEYFAGLLANATEIIAMSRERPMFPKAY
jgi:hypothetical protein